MKCPNCRAKAKETRVTSNEERTDHNIRYRRCLVCGHKWKTEEVMVKYKEREQYGNTKLNPQKVREIRKLAKERGEDGKTSNSNLIMELALELEVEYPTIQNVILKKSWKHID